MTRALIVKIFSVITGLAGACAFLFFFPLSGGCSDLIPCLLYSFCGLYMFITAIPLFLLKERARMMMFYFSWFFFCLYIYESYQQLATDHTGQGLIGILLITPIFFVCVAAIVLLPATKAKQQ